LGDSATEIKKLLPLIIQPIVFWLDAHFAGGGTAFGKEEVPLLRELEEICKRNEKDLILIDDLRLIGKKGKSGVEGDQKYPIMDYDWTNISLKKIKLIINTNTKNGYKNVWFTHSDTILIFRNQSIIESLVVYIRFNFFNLKEHFKSKARILINRGNFMRPPN